MVCEPRGRGAVGDADGDAADDDDDDDDDDVAIRTPATTFAPHARTWGHIRIRSARRRIVSFAGVNHT